MISRFLAHTGREHPRVIAGIGDDAAVLDVSGEKLLLATCDAQIDGVHFRSEESSPRDIGTRTAAVNLSDIAAMGGTPAFALLSIASPPRTEVAFLEHLYNGIQETLRTFGAVIVGGNTAALPERLSLDLTLLGEVSRKHLLTRRGARVGDILCVTGALGASVAGLMLQEDCRLIVDGDARADALRAYRSPTPRVREGRCLGETGSVTACIDVSDGLLADAGHLAEQSGVRLRVAAEQIPVAECAVRVAGAAGRDVGPLAMTGGEDFELLFTVQRDAVDDVLSRLVEETGTSATPIGEVIGTGTEVVVEHAGKRVSFEAGGFDHFSRRDERSDKT